MTDSSNIFYEKSIEELREYQVYARTLFEDAMIAHNKVKYIKNKTDEQKRAYWNTKEFLNDARCSMFQAGVALSKALRKAGLEN